MEEAEAQQHFSHAMVQHGELQNQVRKMETERDSLEMEVKEIADMLKKRETELEAMKIQRKRVTDTSLILDLMDAEEIAAGEIDELRQKCTQKEQACASHLEDLSFLKEHQKRVLNQGPLHGRH